MSRYNRLGLGFLDQVLSSASNMIAMFAIARVSSVREFGSISLAVAAVFAAVILCRGLLGTPITLLSDRPDELSRSRDYSLGMAALIGSAVALALSAAAPYMAETTSVLLVAAASPFVLIQDCARFSCIAGAQPRQAVLSDGMWLGGSSALFLAASTMHHQLDTHIVVGGWIASSAVATVAILIVSRARLRFHGMRAWFAEDRVHRLRYGFEAGISAVNGFLFLSVTALLVGSAAIASLRGAGSLMGPLNILLASIPLVLVSELRRSNFGHAQVWKPLRRVAVGLSVVAVAVGVGSIWVPDSWGEILLGPTWQVAQPLLPVTGIEYVGIAWAIAAQAVLRLKANSRAVLRVRLVHAVLILGATLIAAVTVGTAFSIAVGLAIASLIAAVCGTVASIRTVPAPDEKPRSVPESEGMLP